MKVVSITLEGRDSYKYTYRIITPRLIFRVNTAFLMDNDEFSSVEFFYTMNRYSTGGSARLVFKGVKSYWRGNERTYYGTSVDKRKLDLENLL